MKISMMCKYWMDMIDVWGKIVDCVLINTSHWNIYQNMLLWHIYTIIKPHALWPHHTYMVKYQKKTTTTKEKLTTKKEKATITKQNPFPTLHPRCAVPRLKGFSLKSAISAVDLAISILALSADVIRLIDKVLPRMTTRPSVEFHVY